MADTKVLTPEVIPDTPLPMQSDVPFGVSDAATNQTYTQSETKEQPLPRKVIAHETIGAALNTKSKKILQEFELVNFGGLRIGKHEQGISGDIRITPNGIVARNQGGQTTFAIDAETGDAIFLGKVRAGDFEVIDELGIVSPNVFNHDKYRIATTVTKNLTFSTEEVSPLDFLNIVCERDTVVVVSLFANVKLYATDPIRGYYIRVGLSIDGSPDTEAYGELNVSNMEADTGTCISFMTQIDLEPGIHEISMWWAGFTDSSSDIGRRGMDYTKLGS